MTKGRLEAFSDGVIAIIITIMVLELKVPKSTDLAALSSILPLFTSYLLSFVFVGIYWNNHHHLFQAANSVNGRILWANLHLLFWLSLIPFVTAWMGNNQSAPWPMAFYGIVLLCAGFAYAVLARSLAAHHGRNSLVATAIGRDWKGFVSIVLYATAIPLSFESTWMAATIYILVALMWLIPDSRIEKTFVQQEGAPHSDRSKQE
jgi:uncharacterized membrane protein